MELLKLDGHLKKTENGSYLLPCTKLNYKWIKDLNRRPATLKLIEEKTEDSCWEREKKSVFFNEVILGIGINLFRELFINFSNQTNIDKTLHI